MTIFLSTEDREKRKAICDACESKDRVFCKECGCFLIALQKVKKFECQKNKWS
jgi:hypothetical protein